MIRGSISRSGFLKQWLLHAFVIWTALTITDALNFLLKAQSGMRLIYADGSVATLWSRMADHNTGQQLVWLPILLTTGLIEWSYHYVFKTAKIKVFIITTLLCGIACMVLFRVPDLLAGRGLLPAGNFWTMASTVFSVCGLFSAYAFLYAITRDYIHTRIYKAEKQLRHSQAELAALKAQINPHFFFNTLNNIFGTALEEKAERTAHSIERLSGLMRYVVNGSQNTETPVAHEIKFVREYLALQRMRIPDQSNIHIEEYINYDGKPANIAPLLLLPFIENAFHYGISIDHECHVNVSLTVREQQLEMQIANRILAVTAAKKGHGTGIENTRKQLELLYPDRHQLTITRDNGQFVAALRIDIS